MRKVNASRQVTGDREQGTGYRGQGTGKREKVTAQLSASAESKSKGKGQRAKMQQPRFSIFECPVSIFHIFYGMSDSGGRTSSK
jgi:hypothetical protein